MILPCVNGRISCEKSYYYHINSATGKPHDRGIIFEKVLTDKEKNMTLDELKMVYPYKGI